MNLPFVGWVKCYDAVLLLSGYVTSNPGQFTHTAHLTWLLVTH